MQFSPLLRQAGTLSPENEAQHRTETTNLTVVLETGKQILVGDKTSGQAYP